MAVSATVANQDMIPDGLRMAAAYAWRILVLGAVAYALLNIVGRLEFVIVALFVGLIVAALVGPWVKILDRIMPRGLAVSIGLLSLFVLVLGILTFIGTQVAGEWGNLLNQFRSGITEIESWLENGPLHINSADFAEWYDKGRQWVIEHRGDLTKTALGGAGAFLEGFAGFALAIFSSVFFLAGGRKIWEWVLGLFPLRTRPRLDGAGYVAWRSFAGYTRGIIIVAAVNSTLVCILLLVLRVPLALPLALIVFFGTFIPLIGAPLAMLIAAVVGLAARGPIVAIIILCGIALLGQFEGHVLQPLVMSRAVNIHPLAVAVAVVSGTALAGLVGAVVAVPIVSVCYGVAKFWVQTAPRSGLRGNEPPVDPTGTGAAGGAPALAPAPNGD